MKTAPLFVLAGSLLSVSLVAQQATFKARVDGVRVDVLVTEGGRPVQGLVASDFEVRDNGVRQEVTLVSVSDVPIGIVLTLDSSASLAGPRLENLARAGRGLLAELVPGDAASLITFNTSVTQRVPMTADRERVRLALSTVAGAGDTSLIDASLAALLSGDTDAGRTLVVVFSDGVDTASFMRADSVLATARRVNSIVYAVWSGSGDSEFLRDLADATGGRVLDIGESGDPGPAFVEILREFRKRYVITFTPPSASAGGWHTLEVRVNRRGVKTQARTGYYAAQP